MANERGGSDNISLIILSSEGSDIKEPEPPEPDDATTEIIS